MILLDAAGGAVVKWGHVKEATSRVCRGGLPCNEPGEPFPTGIQDRRGLRGVSENAGGGMHTHGLDGACVCFDGKPLPSVVGNPGGESGGGNAMGAEHLYPAL